MRLLLLLLICSVVALPQQINPLQVRGFSIQIPNDGSTGTTLNQLAKINSTGHAIKTATTDTAIPVFITIFNAGRFGSASLGVGGKYPCQMDAGGATIGHFIVNSATTAGRCSDAGATAPTTGWVIGIAETTASANALSDIFLLEGYNAAAGGGTVAPPYVGTFTGTGSVTVTAVTHQQGTHPHVDLFDSLGNYTAVPLHCKTGGGATIGCADATSNGDVVIGTVASGTYTYLIYGAAGVGPAGPTGPTGPAGAGGSVFTGSTGDTPAFSATPTFNLADCSTAKSCIVRQPGVMTANVTAVTFTNTSAGAHFFIEWTQDGTGGRAVTYGGSTITTCQPITAANATTSQEFVVQADGTTVKGMGCTGSSGTVATVQNCGSTSSCAGLTVVNPIIVIGNASLVSGSPSSVTITGAPFSSSSTYYCTATALGIATGVALSVNNISGSSFQITSPSSTSAGINYICGGA